MLSRSWFSFPQLFLSSVLFLSVYVDGVRQLRTIDDFAGDSAIAGALPIYSPPGKWSPQPGGCTDCNIKPDNLDLIFNGHWRDTTHFARNESRAIQFSFTGVALSVFCILPPSTAVAIVTYNLTFTLDGSPVGSRFTRTKDQLTDKFQYNVSVFSLDNLTNMEHTFLMEMDENTDSVALFDYASYVYDDEGIVVPKKRVNTRAIVGGVLGALAFIAGAWLLFSYARRRRVEVRTQQVARDVQPFPRHSISLEVSRQAPKAPNGVPQTNAHLATPESTWDSPPVSSISSYPDTEKGPPPAYSPYAQSDRS
ncbi:hypothetical protein V5O48_001558 [Marasmius crinis-equi]|uniref:Transmembrane protein n=1 Tax=Marasmius crinis-equi TaxID=585013 RepID=A0ABR3FY63_9AGAR